MSLHALLLVENAAVPHDRRVWNEARALQRNGYRVTVVCPKGRAGADAATEHVDGVDIRRFPMPFGGRKKLDFLGEYGWAMLAIFWHTLRIWRRDRFDVIHVANPPDFFFPLGWFFGRKGVKFIFDQHDLSPETYQSKFDEADPGRMYDLLRWFERKTFDVSDAVISTNESYRARAIERGGMDPEQVVVVRNSPDTDLFVPRDATSSLKDGYEHLCVFVGTMGFQDGVHLLLEAAHHVREVRGRDDVLFVIMGTGDMWDTLQARHAELELGDGVRFTGFIPDDDMLDYLATADVGAAPDIDAPLNHVSTMIKTMDYMAMGVPIVSLDLVESRFSAQDAALYVDGSDPASFGDGVIELLDDPARRAQMAAAGRERITGPLSWSVSEAALLRTYDIALRGTRLGSAPATS